jgi:hypothetical protein
MRPVMRRFSMLVVWNSKISCVTIVSRSRSSTSVTRVTRRTPSGMRSTWMMISIAATICSRIARSGNSVPAISTIVSRRESESRGELAWVVVMPPSWPVFMAWSMSSASGPRHSPTMMRSGRMRRALMTSSRMVTSPLPSMLGGRFSSRMTCFWRICNSAASSMVMMRSPAGMKLDRTFSSVVLPEPVPPEMTMFSRPRVQADRNSTRSGVMVPKASRSSTVRGSRLNLRTVSTGPVSDTGGMMALTREPSGRRASTIGLESSQRRPSGAMMRSMMRRTCSSLSNLTSVS